MINITPKELRTFLVTYQGLNTRTFANKQGILEFVQRVGCLQYDPLNVVGRNMDLVLQSRIKNYKPTMLTDLLYNDRALIDGWDKMMAVYSVSDWSNFYRVRAVKKIEVEGTLAYRNSTKALDHVDKVTRYVKLNGSSRPSNIDLGSTNRGSWGHGKIASATMDYMFNIGTLGIYNKNNTQKIYDLIENLLPQKILNAEDPFKTDKEFYKWYIKRRIGSIGIYWNKSGGGWLGHFISKSNLRIELINELVEDGELTEIIVTGFTENFYIRSEDIHLLENLKPIKNPKAKFLAPLDNLLWDRKLIKDLFNFDYKWEVYKPVKLREYGYYVLPVLYGNKLVARFEPELQRGSKHLELKNWWWEKNFKPTEKVIDAVLKEFTQFCKYLSSPGLSKLSIELIKRN
ncbi:MAG: winged helix DNA-binding domain-containing protein [Spirochaetaceae bacterium]